MPPTDREALTDEERNPTWEPTPENVKRWAEVRRRNGDTEAFVRLTVIADRLRSPGDREGSDLHDDLVTIHGALDDALGDRDIDWMDDEELRREEPVQWAAGRLADIVMRLRAASTDAPTEERGVDLDRSLTAIEADRKELELSEDFPPESEVPDDLFGIIIHAAWVLSFARSREWQNVRAEIVQLAKELRAPTDEAPEREGWPEWGDEYVEDIAERFEKGGIGMHQAFNIPQVILDECARRLRQPDPVRGEGEDVGWPESEVRDHTADELLHALFSEVSSTDYRDDALGEILRRLRAASTDAPSEELDLPALTYAASQALDDGDDDIAEALIRIRDRLGAPTDEAPEGERLLLQLDEILAQARGALDRGELDAASAGIEWAQERVKRRLRQPEPARDGGGRMYEPGFKCVRVGPETTREQLREQGVTEEGIDELMDYGAYLEAKEAGEFDGDYEGWRDG